MSMPPFKEFLREAGAGGLVSMAAAIATLILSVWDRGHDKPASAYLFLFVSLMLFWIGAFLAWHKKYKECERLRRPADCPVIRISAWGTKSQNQTDPPFGFFLDNDGDGSAHEVMLENIDFAVENLRGGIVTAITARGRELMPIWNSNLGSFLGNEKWDLPAVFRKASEQRDNSNESPHGAPNYEVKAAIAYRDFRNFWYRSVVSVAYVPAKRDFEFMLVSHNVLDAKPQSGERT